MANAADRHWLEPPGWWKRWKPLRWLAMGLMLAGLVSMLDLGHKAVVAVFYAPHPETDYYTRVEPDRVPFLAGMKSYDSLDTVSGQLTTAGYTYTLTQNHAVASEKYPPRNRDTLEVDAYKHLRIEGRLTLQFFNNRLYEAMFVPVEPAAYVEPLHKADPRLKRDRYGMAERVVGNLRVVTNVDFAVTDVGRSLQTSPYVIWQDLRLVRQLDEWDSKYVFRPAPPKG